MTWTLNNCHYLLFPMATSNVEVYWEDHPKPIMDLGTVQWISKQVLGMTSAIDSVHNPPSDTLLPPENQLYGRHGDLKPENILHYSSPKDERGIWIIADLGLTALNSVFSRSNLSNGKVQCSPRYKPPECDLIGGKISRSYDIWTFGCVLLEMIIWALEGDEERRRFLRHLDKPYLTGSRSDKFFDIMIKATGGHVVLVKNEVYEVNSPRT
jgi:serine/threonine protein kinase